METVRILGVDPGSRLTGYGCIDVIGNQIRHVGHGTLRLASTSGKATVPLEARLLLLHGGLLDVIKEYRPQIMVVEKVFFAKNAVSALKLGQARGAVVLTGAMSSLTIVEYNPTEVKATVVGHGRADKGQVAKMVKLLTGCSDFETYDASDAMALAICHAQNLVSINGAANSISSSFFCGRKKKRKRLSMAESLGLR